jgi:hypothetical protein
VATGCRPRRSLLTPKQKVTSRVARLLLVVQGGRSQRRGGDDRYVIVDAPDNESATAVTLTVNTAGGATVKTVVLLTQEVDAAAKRSVEYRPPGA